MRWLQIGNFHPRFSTENYLAESIRRRGDVVETFQENDLGAWRAAAEQVADFDVALWTHTPWNPNLPHNLQRLFLAAAERAHVPVIAYHLDRWWGLGREREVHSEPFFRSTLVCTADGGHEEEFAAAGITHRWTPPAVGGWHAEPRGHIREEFVCDLMFVGRWQGYHSEWPWRQRLVAWLQQTYGDRCQFHGGDLDDDSLNDAYVSARVVVGDSCLAGGATRYWSNRIPETTARGGLLVHPNVEGLAEHFTPGEHLVTFDLGDFAQLGGLIDHFIAETEERDAVREAGRAHALARHTFAARLDEILDDLMARGMLRAAPAESVAGRAGPVVVRTLDKMVAFDLRAGSTDGIVVDEAWSLNAYDLHPGDVAGGLVLDVGANIGSFALWAAAVGAEQVIAYEPQPENAERLRAHVARNPVGAVVQIEELAVTSTDGASRISLLEPGDEGGAHIVGAEDPGIDVAAISLRSAVLGALAVNGHREVAVLKIDAEGSEYEMLAGLGDTLQLVRHIALEFHGPWMSKPDARKLDASQARRFGALCAELAEHGSIEVVGRPSVGGYIYWRRYQP